MVLKKEIIKDRLVKMIEFLRELEQIEPLNFDEYLKNPAIKRACERLIQLIVETAADINSSIIVGSKKTPPKDYYETFIKVAETGFISAELSKELASWAGLRNRIVHEYNQLKDNLVFEKIRPTIEKFRIYLSEAEKFLVSNK